MDEQLSDRNEILQRLRKKNIGKDVLSSLPKVSVVIPAHNVSDFIADTLNSVLAQDYPDFETIVINDGSRDTAQLETILEAFYDKIIYGRQDPLGASEARNSGICLARGELIAFLDGDDIWHADYLRSQVNFLEAGSLDMVYADAEFFGENFLPGRTYMETTPSDGEVNPISLLSGTCNVITSGTVVRKEILAGVGLFDTDSKRAQDFDLWFRLAKNGAKIGYQRDVLLKYRVSSSSLSGSNVQRAERNITVLNLVRNKYQFSPEEERVWEKQMAFSRAEVELEKGKFSLVEGNYPEAREHFARANQYYRKPKLTLLRFLLKFAPVLTLRLFKRFRPAEFSFIAPKETPQ